MGGRSQSNDLVDYDAHGGVFNPVTLSDYKPTRFVDRAFAFLPECASAFDIFQENPLRYTFLVSHPQVPRMQEIYS